MDKPWFDESGLLMLDDYIMMSASYQRITDDHAINDEEIAEQAQRVAELLKQLEGMLSPEAKAVATDALSELSVLSLLQAKRAGGA
ncbi:MAG: hypothetical protein M3437_00020 [Chloroflexota bacterium]|nr:hypothetical protein [Chloroflexota bacterium]MDQ5865600.1 hypothetical protein [Chloroflexota bacterium]